MTEIIVALIALAGVMLTNASSNRKVSDSIAKLERHRHDDHLALLRLTIMSPDMPIDERIAAGKRYIAEGGNGGVKAYYNDMLKRHIK